VRRLRGSQNVSAPPAAWVRTMPTSGRGSGFTLVELLIAAAIGAVLLAALLGTVAGALRVWERTRVLSTRDADALLTLHRLERDLRNRFSFYGVRPEGHSDRIQFAGFVRRPADEAVIGTVRYFWDTSAHALKRKAWAYPAPEPDDREAEALISSLDAVRLSYYYAAPEPDHALLVRPDWIDERTPPVGVRIELDLRRASGLVTIERTFYLPGAWSG
jgi:prepilin-type N-terminal cleavage/methylation domain-containing protein